MKRTLNTETLLNAKSGCERRQSSSEENYDSGGIRTLFHFFDTPDKINKIGSSLTNLVRLNG